MVNEERVKQLYKIAIYEQNEEKEHRQTGLYYRSDYVGKEIVKSFFTGSIAYIIIAALWVFSNWDLVLYQINNLEIVQTIGKMLIAYAIFVVVYLFITAIVYFCRYRYSKKRLDAYVENIKVAHNMFEREEKLKK
jgi:hypothetical protein